VRHRRVRADEARRIEGDRLRPTYPEEPLQLQRERLLADALDDPRQQRREGSVGDRARGRDALELGRLLRRPVGFDPALDRDELDLGRRRFQPLPEPVRHEARLDRHSSRAERGQELRPRTGQVVAGVLDAGCGRLSRRLDLVARVGEDDDFIATDEELAGVARDLLLAVGQDEARQVAAVLTPDAEVGVDLEAREPGADAFEASRSGRVVGLGPAGVLVGGRRRSEVGRSRPAGRRRRHR
jgi:hypothetical protein